MTGAPLPRGADTVIAQEDALVEGDMLRFDSSAVVGRHVRRRGEEIQKGAMVLSKGHVINPGSVACLAAVGRDQVRVIRKPAVAVITTGDETVPPGKQLRDGQIFDSNSAMMIAILEDMGIKPYHRRVKDQPRMMANAAKAALKNHDVVIFVGGVSVGAKDFLRPVLGKEGVKEIFWRVSQKPGKPLYFGTKGKRLVFGLPGNPASAFTCFYVYVYPALRRLSGVSRPALYRSGRTASEAIKADAKKWRFLKAAADEDEVTPLGYQGSHMITSLAQANSFIVVPPGPDEYADGERFETINLPFAEEGSD